jgi:hypothetical protein
MPTRSTLVDAILRRGLAALLRNHGFSKSRHTFRRAAGDCLQITGVQGDRFNMPGSEAFTINLGVHFEQVDKLTGQEWKGQPCAEDAVLSIRIGSLMEARSDKWWQVSNESEVEQAADAAAHAWLVYAWPWFTQCETVAGAQKFAADRNLCGTALLLALANDDNLEARKWLAVVASGTGGMARKWHLDIAAKRGLSMEGA